GNLKSLIVLIVLGISAYMTLKGLFAVWRVNALDGFRFDIATLGAPRSDLPSIVTAMIGSGALVKIGLPLLMAALFAVWACGSRDFRASHEMIVGGVVIGAVIVGGWYVPGHIGHLAEEPRTLE